MQPLLPVQNFFFHADHIIFTPRFFFYPQPIFPFVRPSPSLRPLSFHPYNVPLSRLFLAPFLRPSFSPLLVSRLLIYPFLSLGIFQRKGEAEAEVGRLNQIPVGRGGKIINANKITRRGSLFR